MSLANYTAVVYTQISAYDSHPIIRRALALPGRTTHPSPPRAAPLACEPGCSCTTDGTGGTAMARVTVTRQWPDDDGLRIEVSVGESFPDAVDEAVTAALRAYREALGISVTFDEDAGE